MVPFNRRDRSLAPQDSLDGSESGDGLGKVLEQEAQENMVEVRIGKRELEQVCLVELDVTVAGSLNSEARLPERGRGNVNAHNVRRRVSRSKENRLRSRPASAFQNQALRGVRGVMVEQFA